MIKNKPLEIILAIFLIFLCGCSLCQEQIEAVSTEIAKEDMIITKDSNDVVVAQTEVNGKKIYINAPAYNPETQLYLVQLERDTKKAEEMANDLVLTDYPNVQRDNQWRWNVIQDNKLVVSYGCDMFWNTSYLDVTRDQDGYYLEEEYLFKEHLTSIIPDGSNLSPESAAKTVIDFVNQNSAVFNFSPFCQLAAVDGGNKEGYYTVWTKGYYKNIPVCKYHDPNTATISFSAYIGNNGIFAFSGLFLLLEVSRQPVSICPATNAARHLCDHFNELTVLDDIHIDRIELEYFLLTNQDGSFTLRPVWIFSGNAQNIGSDVRAQIRFLYFADDCTLCGVY